MMENQVTELQLIEVIEAVRKYEQRMAEKTWIHHDTELTFFGVNDWWIYGQSESPNMCGQCDFYGNIKFFNGTDIRGTFPYLNILDDDTIEPWVHPHCGCLLTRVLGSVEP